MRRPRCNRRQGACLGSDISRQLRMAGGADGHLTDGAPGFPSAVRPPSASAAMMQSALAPCHAFQQDPPRNPEMGRTPGASTRRSRNRTSWIPAPRLQGGTSFAGTTGRDVVRVCRQSREACPRSRSGSRDPANMNHSSPCCTRLHGQETHRARGAAAGDSGRAHECVFRSKPDTDSGTGDRFHRNVHTNPASRKQRREFNPS